MPLVSIADVQLLAWHLGIPRMLGRRQTTQRTTSGNFAPRYRNGQDRQKVALPHVCSAAGAGRKRAFLNTIPRLSVCQDGDGFRGEDNGG
jgi:hypothetical protein